MLGLPAIVEGDIATFGTVIQNLQCIVGDHFARAQGGRFTSAKVADALLELEREGAVGLGQSSWGPTGFCLVESPRMAEDLLERALAHNWVAEGLDVRIATPRNHGARISTITHGIEQR